MSIVDGGFWNGDKLREDLPVPADWQSSSPGSPDQPPRSQLTTQAQRGLTPVREQVSGGSEMSGPYSFAEESPRVEFQPHPQNNVQYQSFHFPNFGNGMFQSSAAGSVMAHPPSDERSYFTTTNPSATIATPLSHTDPPNALIEEFCPFKPSDGQEIVSPAGPDAGSQFPDALFWCPFLRYLTTQPHSLENPELTHALMGVDNLLRTEDIEGYRRLRAEQGRNNEAQPVPPTNDGSEGSSGRSRDGYLCPNAGDDPRSVSQGRNSQHKFRCPMCPKGFGKKNDLRKHMQARNSPQKYTCQGCKREYNRLDKFRNHIRKKHPELPYDDNDYLEQACVPMQQSYPEICLQCAMPLEGFDDWFDHWISVHKASPATRVAQHRNSSRSQTGFNPRQETITSGSEAINRFVRESDYLEGYRVGANDVAHDDNGLRQTVHQLDQQARGI